MLGSIRSVRVTLTSLALGRVDRDFTLPATWRPPPNRRSKPTGAGQTATVRPLAKRGDAPPARAGGKPRESPWVLRPARRRPAASLCAASSLDRGRSPADRGRAALQRGPRPGRSARLVRRGDLAPGGAQTRSRLDRHRASAVPDLRRCLGASRAGPAVRQAGPGHRSGRHRHPDPAGRLLQEERPGRGRGTVERSSGEPQARRPRAGRLLAEFELGKLYSGRLHQIDKAADAYAKVLAALDDKSANRLSPVGPRSRSGR